MMKIFILFFITIMAVASINVNAQNAKGREVDAATKIDLFTCFTNPPEEAKPWVYWYWMRANVTSDGITRDLEAMAEAGIGGAYLMTIGNANETALWIREHDYTRILVVTNNYHMPRSLMELAQASPDVIFVAHPVTHADLKTETWLSDPVALRTLFVEYAKYSLARLRNWSGAKTASGLRADIGGDRPVAASLH